MNIDMVTFLMVWFWGSMELYHIYPLESGLIRRKVRRDRRPGMPIENALTFYPRYAFGLVSKHIRAALMLGKLYWFAQSVKRDPKSREYTDTALSTQTGGDVDNLEMFQFNESARQAGEKAKRLSGKLEKVESA
jgi:hypothetical protein